MITIYFGMYFLSFLKVDRTFDALEKDNRRGSRRISAVLRTQKDEDEERQKILMDMNARSLEKGIALLLVYH